MPGEQEQQPREQQGRGSRPYVVPPRGSRGEQRKADRQQGKEGENSHSQADFMIHAPHGREDLQQGCHADGQEGCAPGRGQTPGQKNAQTGQ